MIEGFKPLLAEKADLSKIKYPVMASFKLDGIRCSMIDGKAYSRKLKLIPNQFIQEKLGGLHGLDGELMVSGGFNSVQSAVMSKEEEPNFKFVVFDTFLEPEKGYAHRESMILQNLKGNPYAEQLKQHHILSEDGLLDFHKNAISLGYEGTVIRQASGPYKFGRSTVNQGYLLKLKDFFDDEAILVEITEKMHNNNPATKDELGNTKRSTCKENLQPTGTSGGVILEWNGLKFKAGFGEGIDAELKQRWWEERRSREGKLVTFRYQELTEAGVPRFAKLVGFREELEQ